MANEIHIAGTSGRTCYVNIFDYNGQRWNGTAFESFSSSNIASYAVTVTEDGSTGIYVGNFPTGIDPGTYDLILFIQAGASPADGDIADGSQNLEWFGSGTTPPTPPSAGETTYAEIKTQVIYNLGRGNDTDIIAQLDMWARFAIKDIINWRDHWFLAGVTDIPTVASQQDYDLPDDYKGNAKLTIVKTDRFVDMYGPIDIVEAQRRFTPAQTGEPTDWSHSVEGEFKVWPPLPDAVYTMRLHYMRYIADLVDDDDTNTLTILYPQLLVAMMTKYGFMYLQEYDDVAFWDGEIYGVQGRKMGILADLHANYVARTLGRDFGLTPRADVRGHADQSRGTAAYIIIK